MIRMLSVPGFLMGFVWMIYFYFCVLLIIVLCESASRRVKRFVIHTLYLLAPMHFTVKQSCRQHISVLVPFIYLYMYPVSSEYVIKNAPLSFRKYFCKLWIILVNEQKVTKIRHVFLNSQWSYLCGALYQPTQTAWMVQRADDDYARSPRYSNLTVWNFFSRVSIKASNFVCALWIHLWPSVRWC